jgi:hypothetical protein
VPPLPIAPQLLSAYRSKIAKLEEAAKKRGDAVHSKAPKQVEEAIHAVATLKENFKAALAEADARSSELERERADLQAQLADAHAKLQGGCAVAAASAATADVVPAANVERHIEGLSKATSALAHENVALASSLTNASGLEEDDESAIRAKELAAMHQKLLQLHVGFIMHSGQEGKLQTHSDALAALSERDMELAWFWFRGAISALGGALRGRTNAAPQQKEQQPEEEGELEEEGDEEEDRGANIAWGEEDEEEGAWSEEEVDDEVAQRVESLEPFLGHVPHWKFKDRHFPALEPFSAIAARAEEYCGPSDESNWVIPGVLLVGAFPSVVDDDENYELITSILGLGITTFVCLQDEYSDDAAEDDWRNERNGAIRPYFRDVREIVKQVEEAPADFPSIGITSSDLHFVHFPIIDCDIAEDHSVTHAAFFVACFFFF